MQIAEQTGQPLFLDFWGVTCKSCTAMKATTFKAPAVIEKMQPWVKVAVQADAANSDIIAAVLRHYDVVGLPTYLPQSSQNSLETKSDSCFCRKRLGA